MDMHGKTGKLVLVNQSLQNWLQICLKRRGQIHFRVGISVGKKIGNAVARNWVKRRIRQTLTDLKPQLKQDCDFLVIARPTVAWMSTAEVKKHLSHVLRLAKVLPANNKAKSEELQK